MKRIIALVIVCCLFPLIAVADLSPYYKLYGPLETMVYNEQYDDFMNAIAALKKEHPLLMEDSWFNRLTSAAQEAKESVPDMKSEYDAFDDYTYYWFGDHRKASQEDNCVVVQDENGRVISFFFPVEDHIGIESYAAIYNGNERFEGYVHDHVFDNIGSMLYESFTVYPADIPEEVTSLAFRFYGENKQIDYTLDPEEVEQVNMFIRREARNEYLKGVLKRWNNDIDKIVDKSYIPYSYSQEIEKGATMHPAMTNDDFWNFEVMPSAVSIPEKWYGTYLGHKYCISADLYSIHENNGVLYHNDSWECESGNKHYFIMISDHAKEMGWNQPTPKEGDHLLLGVTFAGVDSLFNYPIFLLGFDEETEALAKKGISEI